MTFSLNYYTMYISKRYRKGKGGVKLEFSVSIKNKEGGVIQSDWVTVKGSEPYYIGQGIMSDGGLQNTRKFSSVKSHI